MTRTPPLATQLRVVRSRRVVAVIAALLIGLALLLAAPLSAQTLSSPTSMPLIAIRESNLTVAALSGSGQTVTAADSAITPYSSSVQVSVAWDFRPNTVNNVRLVGYFMSSAAALVASGASLPSSVVEGRVGTTGTWGAFDQSYAYSIIPANAGNARLLYTSPSTLNSNRKMSVTLDLYLRLNLSNRVVTPGTYSGTLMLQAQAQ